MTGMVQLEQLAGQGLLSSLDIHFAELMGRLADDRSLELLLAAALTSNAVAKGHLCMQLESFAELRLGKPTVCALPPRAEWEQRLHRCAVVGVPGEFAPLILDNRGRLYLQRYWQYEHELAQELLRRAAEPVETLDEAALRLDLERLFPTANGELPDWQKLAAATAVLRNFTLISGGPGTGKTSIVVRILALLQRQAGSRLEIALAAPTGKAAARLQASIRQAKLSLPLCQERVSAIPEQAVTLHRLLGSSADSTHFRYHAGNPLAIDLLILDEASMVDIALMARLLQALPSRCRLIILGDRHQLASVEAGSMLSDIYGHASGFTPGFCRRLERVTGEPVAPSPEPGLALSDSVVTLRHSYRFGRLSGIGQLAGAVNAGDGDEALRQLRNAQADDLLLRDWREDPVAPALAGYGSYLKLVQEGASAAAVFDAFEQFQVLTALSLGARGALQMNRAIEAQLMAVGLVNGGSAWYPGRPIIVRRNDYNLRLYNGDIGILLPDRSRQLRVCFPAAEGLFRWIAPSRLPQWELAYAMTVHKSQGSEFGQVLLVLPENDAPLLTRELIYTAVTRAKERFEIIASEALLKLAVARRLQRPSGLKDALWGEGANSRH